ncbi:hypothetical protein DMN91_010703 [Ooceraea biroi]|uniref:Uncharacterized protein n=1 Tax=Ooceraea biroi TaxID=2015173 RepID=A0A3L8D846_OOCBI|nr:hypothetical protein DMN91_010703 [Ooceraea biroi]
MGIVGTTVASRRPPVRSRLVRLVKRALLGSLMMPINNERHERLAFAIQHALAFGRTDDKGFGAVLPLKSARRIASGLMNAPRATSIDAPSSVSNAPPRSKFHAACYKMGKATELSTGRSTVKGKKTGMREAITKLENDRAGHEPSLVSRVRIF